MNPFLENILKCVNCQHSFNYLSSKKNLKKWKHESFKNKITHYTLMAIDTPQHDLLTAT